MFKPIKELYQTGKVRELDRLAIEEFNIPGYTLMERAGQAAFEALRERWPQAKRVLVVCGKGNNAGDGYVVARLAHEAGLEVKVSTVVTFSKLKGDAFDAARNCAKKKIEIERFQIEDLQDVDLVVDALLGSGITGEVRGEYLAIINSINSLDVPVVSLDIPSGLNANTGNVAGGAISADLTVTFVGAKRGLFTGEAADYCGEVLFADLEIPAAAYERLSAEAEMINLADLPTYLPKRKRCAHKGNFGRILVVGGDYGMAGAVRMSAEAAARSGAGMVKVATRPEHISVVAGTRPELMCRGVQHRYEVEELLEWATIVVLGPGLGTSDWSKELFATVLRSDLPMILDADGLNLLARQPVKRENWIITPHPGEASRLLKCTVNDVQSDRFAATHSLQHTYGGVSILKGAGTLVAGGEGLVGVAPFANPGMATAGMGDVLSGIIAGLLAQGLSLENAARFGVTLHAKAAECAVEQTGVLGLLATDLYEYVRRLLNERTAL